MNLLAKTKELGFKCAIALSDFHFWQNLNSYISLIEEFLNKKISGKEFETRFYEMHSVDGFVDPEWEELVYIVRNFNLADFEGITALMSELFITCDSFESNCELIEEGDLTEEELSDYVAKMLLKIKSRYVNS